MPPKGSKAPKGSKVRKAATKAKAKGDAASSGSGAPEAAVEGRVTDVKVELGGPQRKKRRVTVLQEAVWAEVVPPARRPFALFVKDQMKKSHLVSGRGGYRSKMKEVAELWRGLSDMEKQEWVSESKEELEAQRAAAASLGMDTRRRKMPYVPAGRSSRAATPPGSVVADLPATLLGDWQVLPGDKIGEGTYGTVVKVQHVMTGHLAVAKVFKSGHGYQKEMDIYEKLDGHTSFLHVLAACTQPPLSWIVLPMLPGSLSRCQLAGEDLRAFAIQLARGLHYMHGIGNLHLDVKPANVLFCMSTRHAYLCDFSLQEAYPLPDRTSKNDGMPVMDYVTPQYRPPELWTAPFFVKRPKNYVSTWTDVWSYGATILEVAGGRPAFSGKDIKELRDTIAAYCEHRNGPGSFRESDLWVKVPAWVRQLCWHACDPASYRRASLSGSRAGLPWLHSFQR
jgi:hypothetical protein